MIEVTITPTPLWDEKREEFIRFQKPIRLTLEHSLISLSKWESTHCKAFLKNDSDHPKTSEDIIDYIRCMTISPKNVDPRMYYCLSQTQINYIWEYVNDNHTATKIPDSLQKGSAPPQSGIRDTVASELIYYWMASFNIPFECDRWNLSRLLALIHICQVKNTPAKKMPKGEIYKQNKLLNAQRKAKLHTRG